MRSKSSAQPPAQASAEPGPVPADPATSASTQTRKPTSTATRIAFGVLHVGLAVALLGALTVGLHSQASSDVSVVALPPKTVQVITAREATGYETQRRFTGRLEANRQTAVGAERGGRVTEITVHEGQTIKRGDVLARLDTRTLRAQRAEQVARRKTVGKDLDLARLNAKRQRQLKDKGFTSGQAWDAARIQLEAVESSLGQLDAAIRTINVAIAQSVIKAPFSGTVGARLVDEGAMLASGTPVVSLFDGASPQVRVGLSPVAANGLSTERQYQIDVGDSVVAAQLVQVRPDLNETTRTVTALFAVSAVDLPRYGQLVELILPTHHESAGFWLPLTALTAGQRGLWDVLIVVDRDEQMVVAREAVEVLHADGDRVYVRGTLRDGARVIGHGAHRVTVGQPVQLNQASS